MAITSQTTTFWFVFSKINKTEFISIFGGSKHTTHHFVPGPRYDLIMLVPGIIDLEKYTNESLRFKKIQILNN